ncbi:MAG TPA: hypothetical protein VMU40_08930 [Steroidobacteraceae bacterium]|nr:hypothetical protein [Steroidobacteraceae bacterium]
MLRRGPAVLLSGFVALLSAAVGALSARAVEAPVDPSLYQSLQWRLIGPFRGGRVLAVTGVPGDSRHFYFGAVDGGVWTTEDAGRTWRPIFDGEPEGSIGALAIAPSDPRTIYVGTGEADMRSDIAHGKGVYKSSDAGGHWTYVGLADTRQIGRILVDPRNPAVVFVAALGHAYGPNAERGVFRSRDGGQHWQKVLFKDDNTGAIDLAFEPGAPETIYASLWQTRRPPWSVYPPSNGPGSGLYISHDGGDSWARVEGNGFPRHPGHIGLATASSRPERLYALTDGPRQDAGLYRSDDGGAHWSHVSDDARIWKRCWYFCSLTVDPKNADRVYVMDTIVLRSDDGGEHFIALKGDPTGDDFHAMWIDPTNSDRQILGVDQGTLITLDGGKSWSSWFNQPTAQIYHVSTDNRFPYWVYGAQQDSGAVALPSRTDSVDGITMQQFHEVTAGGENGMIAPDPDDPGIVYGGTVDKLDLRSGQTRNVDPTLAYPAAHYRSAWTLPLAFSRSGPRVLYFANQQLFSTSDGGEHWTPISPDLTRPDPGIPANLDAATAADDDHLTQRRGVIYTIAPSPLAAGELWVGTDDGLVWRTDDQGAHWRNITPPPLTAWSKVGGIEPSHFDRDVAYLAIDRHRLEDDAPYLYRTQDGGKDWARIDSGIPRDSFVNVVREDPVTRGLLYAGTERGMFVSFDDGAHWQPLQQNLPMTSVRDIDVHGDDLVIATHGRGFWIMDDISSLRQMTSVQSGEVRLFKPATAIRVRAGGFRGTPMPKDEPLAANPPDGAIIDYLLPANLDGAVTVTILDSQDQVVRRFSSADPVKPPDPSKLEFAPEWVAPAVSVSKLPGMHRLVWNLRYAGPDTASGGEARGGVWAAPGTYSVELGAGGRTYRQPLRVEPDPRTHVSEAALERQFVLARQVAQASMRASAARTQATHLLEALRSRLARPGALHARLASFAAHARDLSGVQLDAFPENVALPVTQRTDSLQALSAALDKLEGAVDGADADPSPDARASYATLAGMLDSTLAEWQRLKDRDLARLNAELKAAHEPPLVP